MVSLNRKSNEHFLISILGIEKTKDLCIGIDLGLRIEIKACIKLKAAKKKKIVRKSEIIILLLNLVHLTAVTR